MSEEIIKVLDDLGNRFGIAIDWTSENVMPYLQDLFTRFINYKIGISIMCLVIFIIMLIVSILVLVKSVKGLRVEEDKNFYEQSEFNWICHVLAIIFSFTTILSSIIGIPYNAKEIIKATTIPEVVIYDYVKTQI